jgi:NTE family protein
LALVFGSGGVKSVAALGVAEVLAQEGLIPDLVVGCSAGAVFGALVASRLPAKECLEMATTLWSREITGLRRRGAWAQAAMAPVFTALSKNFEESFALRDDRLILQRIRQAFGQQRLEDLPTPMLVNATDAATGESVLLSAGSVCDALRASVALPFLFAPWRVGGQLLVDGSVSDPLPVGAAAGAKAVLALGFAVPTPRSVTGPTRLATRITASLTNNLMQARLASHAGPHMITLLPQLDRRVGLFDTDAMPYMIELGRQQARAVVPQLHALLARQDELPTQPAQRHLREVTPRMQVA